MERKIEGESSIYGDYGVFEYAEYLERIWRVFRVYREYLVQKEFEDRTENACMRVKKKSKPLTFGMQLEIEGHGN